MEPAVNGGWTGVMKGSMMMEDHLLRRLLQQTRWTYLRGKKWS